MDVLDWLNLYVSALSAILLTAGVVVFIYWRFLWIKGTSRRTLQQIHTNWRTREAQGIMKHRLLECPIIIQIDYYRSCSDPRAARYQIRDIVIPDGPTWLNDYFIVRALEALSRKEQVVKAGIFRRGDWPPMEESYLFQPKKPGESVEARRKEIETNGRCYQYQRWVRQCPLTYRFEGESTRLLESAAQCERCWE